LPPLHLSCLERTFVEPHLPGLTQPARADSHLPSSARTNLSPPTAASIGLHGFLRFILQLELLLWATLPNIDTHTVRTTQPKRGRLRRVRQESTPAPARLLPSSNPHYLGLLEADAAGRIGPKMHCRCLQKAQARRSGVRTDRRRSNSHERRACSCSRAGASIAREDRGLTNGTAQTILSEESTTADDGKIFRYRRGPDIEVQILPTALQLPILYRPARFDIDVHCTCHSARTRSARCIANKVRLQYATAPPWWYQLLQCIRAGGGSPLLQTTKPLPRSLSMQR
jgi:hypothetical protein